MPRTLLFLLFLALSLAPTLTAQTAKNLLFYGNSYSARNGTVGDVVRLLAVEAGHPAPVTIQRLVSSQDLHFHATDPTQVAAIGNSLPPGRRWDAVVMQGQSLEATAARGDPSLFRSSAVAILGNVRAHSPAAQAILYQTWARALGHPLYPVPFTSPRAMHDEIRGNYARAAADLDAAFGSGSASLARAGDCVALLEWDPTYYESDLHHPAPAVTVLAGMTLFTAIYRQPVCGIAPDFNAGGPLVSRLASLGLGQADWNRLAGLADRCAARDLRSYPGSGDHLLLEGGVFPGALTACPVQPIRAGAFLQVRMRSLNGAFDRAPGFVLLDVFPTGFPPGPLQGLPEIQVAPATAAVFAQSGNLLSPLPLLVPLPTAVPGASILAQGIAAAPSRATGSSLLTATDGIEFPFR